MGVSYMKSNLSSFKISPSFYANRISPSNISSPIQKITFGFNPQLVQSPLMNRASLTGLNNLISVVPLLGGGPTPGFLPGRRRFHHSNPNAIGAFEAVISFCYWCFTICVGRIERVPYTNRLHYVLCDKLAKKWEEDNWDQFENWERTLPKSDPRVVRAESIARNLLEAMNKGLMLQQNSSGSSRLVDHNAPNLGASTGRKLQWKPATKHLDGKDWKVYVRDSKNDYDSDEDICRVFDGKIVISKDLIENLKSDAELATVIARGIGDHVARHFADFSMKIIVLFGFFFLPIGLWSSCIVILLANLYLFAQALMFFFRRMNAEADYIGLMLMASAGYDPQVAPGVYVYLHRHSSMTDELDFLFYPAKKRAKLLKKPETMELAKQIFDEVQARKGVRSFI
ncbi:hypothetical protein PTKIN_Ptkin12aG0196200 [Pterospermum kingtungense]